MVCFTPATVLFLCALQGERRTALPPLTCFKHGNIPHHATLCARNVRHQLDAGSDSLLGSQIVALMTSPGVPGARTIVLLGPTRVVFAALALNLILLGLIIRWNRGASDQRKLNARPRSFGAAAAGLLGSLVVIFSMTIAINLLRP